MGQLQMTQVAHRLDETVLPHIDVSDLSAHGGEQLRTMTLTRALAAFVVMKLTGLTPESAAATVTDGEMDNGIDAVAVLPAENRIVLVQSKWSMTGKGSASLNEMIKFREGIDDLITLDFDSFNTKLVERREEIESLLLKPSVSIDIVFVHMGAAPLAADVRKRMDDYLLDQNDTTEIAAFHYYGQADVHRLLIEEQQSPKISLTVELSDWGQMEGPPMAIYGQVRGNEAAAWYQSYGRPLLAKNVRVVLPDSEVNNSLVSTIQDYPESFWYYNNGITVLCDQIVKSPAGGSDRRVGTFTFDGVSVVNGAQTVGSLAKALAPDSASASRVMVRFISLEGAPEHFASEVTRATNTQNRIGGRDFLSLDPQQSRLRDEFAVEDLEYTFRSGEADPLPADGCSVLEATVALACGQPGSGLAVQAKREISRLWDDISKAPYRTLFNPTTTYLRIWRCVQVLRVVDAELGALVKKTGGRQRGVATHGNRLILHLIFRQLDMETIDDPSADWDTQIARTKTLLSNTVDFVITATDTKEFGGYLASLFKNATRSAGLASTVLASMKNASTTTASVPPNLPADSS